MDSKNLDNDRKEGIIETHRPSFKESDPLKYSKFTSYSGTTDLEEDILYHGSILKKLV